MSSTADRKWSAVDFKIMIAVGFSVRAAVESLRGSGIDEVIAVDFFGDWDLYKLASKVEIARSLSEIKRVLLSYPNERVIYSSVLENHLDILKLVAPRVVGNDAETVRMVRPGKHWWDLAKRLGIRIPKVSLTEESRGKWLIKPFKSGGGRNIFFWEKGMKIKRGYYLQEYIKGEGISFLFLANGKDFLPLGYTRQLIGFRELGGDGFKWCGNVYPYRIERGFKERIEDWVGRLVEKVSLKGANGIDIVIAEEGPYFIEVNPRYTASMELIERAHEVKLMEVHMLACRGDLVRLSLDTPQIYHAKGIIYAERPLTGFKCEEMWERGFRDITREGELVLKGRPVCSVFSRGADEKEAIAGLIREKMWLYERGVGV